MRPAPRAGGRGPLSTTPYDQGLMAMGRCHEDSVILASACRLLAVRGYAHQDWTRPRCSRNLTAIQEPGVNLLLVAALLVAGMLAAPG
jgi:hypothetical protein